MSQPRRTIEQLLKQGSLPLAHADAAAIQLEVYPCKRTWLAFFDKASLVIGSVALVLALVFFIAANWQSLSNMSKFALVEGALTITIALYVVLSFRQRYKLIRQLLLLVASVITGSLLALFGQVYQTGADTWQLFFSWALLITPWVLIARFPALWLLWLGLLNALTLFYIDTFMLSNLSYYYQDFWQFTLITLINFSAFYLWLRCLNTRTRIVQLASSWSSDDTVNTANHTTNHINSAANTTIATAPSQSNTGLHWSTYAVGLLSTCTITYLTITTVLDNRDILLLLLAILLWLGWATFMLQRFRQRHFDLLMLTYLCGSVIAVIVFILGETLLSNFDTGGFLLLALVLIGTSSYAVVWLRKVARVNDQHNVPHPVVKGDSYE